MRTLKLIFVSARPHQWLKNVLVFAAVIFSGQFLALQALLASLITFIAFCFLASAIYILNDVVDRESDRLHPLKCTRPIASGALSVKVALLASFLLALAGLCLGFFVGTKFESASIFTFWILVFYMIMQITYTFWFKHVVIIDVMFLSAGFVLRVLAGGTAIGAALSPWAIICTILLALFLGFGKRRHEIILLDNEASAHRRSLKEYSPYFLDQMIGVTTASTVVAYALYTMDNKVIEKLGTDKLFVTLPFVIYGIFRYLYLVHQKEEGGDPAKALFSDKSILIDGALWFITILILLYFKP